MAAHAGLERMERLGFGAIQPEQGAAAIGSMLRMLGSPRARPQLLASVFFWDRFKVAGDVFAELKGSAAAVAEAAAPVTAPPTAVLAAPAGTALSAAAIQSEVLAAAASVLGAAVAPNELLVAAGLDSLGERRALVGNSELTGHL